MVRRPFTLAALLVGGALVLNACGDDLPTGTNSGDQPSQAEVQELLGEFFELFGLINVNIPGVPLSVTNPYLFLSSTAIPIDESFSVSDQCDAGGSSSASGTVKGDVNEQSGQGNAKLEATVNFANCGVVGTTTTFTVNGDPEIGIVADFQISQTSASISIDVRGGIRFTTTDNRSGSCALDISVSATLSGTSVTISASGRACGHQVTEIDTELFESP